MRLRGLHLRGGKQAVPFCAFLAFGGVVALLAGNELIDWYLNSFVR